jgi:hypothetical protein
MEEALSSSIWEDVNKLTQTCLGSLTCVPRVEKSRDDGQDIWWCCQKQGLDIAIFQCGHDSPRYCQF